MANYTISGGFADTQDNLKEFSNKYSVSDSGPFIGVIKDTQDPLRMGRLGVVIPALSFSDPHHSRESELIWCQYLSPFYGAKPFKAVSTTDPYSHNTSQSAYGMWAIPPDIDTNVLVIFAKGDKNASNAFWIGCIQEPLTNQQVPGLGSTTKSKLGVDTVGPVDVKLASNKTKTNNYGTELLPVSEKNKNMYDEGDAIGSLEFWHYPVNVDLANQLNTQGLIQDPVRGTTTSSARRESPSAVFGINTPGRIKKKSRKPNIGVDKIPVSVDRHSGHSFVMDDGDVEGNNQLTRLRTASGHQLLMHDTEGVVYLANGSGKAWIEMSKNGQISIYSNKGISIRSDGDFNLHSDKNIQFHARENIRFTSEKHLNLNSEGYLHLIGEKGVFSAAQGGSVRHYGKDGITSYTHGAQMHGASGRIDLAGSQVHFNSTSAKDNWGPYWLKPEHERVGIRVTDTGKIDINSDTPIKFGKIQKTTNKTTVRDTNNNTIKSAFITHEPYNRPVVGNEKEMM